ncbi:interferon regulatory factor 5 [Athene noctua]|uniref:interferon regulatory factor 5 n=1 Tax=Athene noctua TaxID=126797 RepID=UPI003EBB02F3
MDPPPRRVRLRPWLVAQVSSQRYPGLRWLDPERRRFVIPWGHATRNTPAPPEHDTIFKAWAQARGRLGAGAAPPRWKATLRCALHKSREFRLLFDGPRARPPRPFRVYELCGGEPRSARGEGRSQHPTSPQHPKTAQHPQHPPSLLADGAAEDDCDSGEEEEEEEEEETTQLPELTALSIEDTQPGGDLLPPWTEEEEEEEEPPSSSCAPGPLVPPPPPLPPEAAGGPPEPPPAPLAEGGPPPGPPAACPLAPAGHTVPNLLISPHMLPLTDLELEFRYRGRRVSALTVSHPQGCRLFHARLRAPSHPAELFGPPALEQVPFPAAAAVPSQKQRFYTQRLLDVLDRGLALELRGQDLYALRLCQCRVFWTGPCAPPGPGPNPIEREKRTKLFSLEGFLNGLILFQKGQSTTPPPFEIFLCFGEEWPDQKPKEKKLIMVQVVPVAARLLLEIFSGELSWSAESVPLQISPPDLKDELVEQFKELHQLWQNQQRLPAAPPQLVAANGGPWGLPPAP